jgi:Tfp pilus assembly protein PilV
MTKLFSGNQNEMKQPLLSQLAQHPVEASQVSKCVAGDELLFMDSFYHSRLVDQDLQAVSLLSVTKWTKVLNETRDDE